MSTEQQTMNQRITRRQFTMTIVGGALAGAVAQAFGADGRHAAHRQTVDDAHAHPALAQIEALTGGRLGVAVLDTATGRQAGWRMQERFPMCSTFKFLLAAAVLARRDNGEEDLARRIVYTKAQVVAYSPASGQHADADGMTVEALCEAALTLSDNTAANLLLASIGGPASLTAFARRIGDNVTRLDRNEPTLNEALADDPRDTTTPAAMLANLQRLLLGHRLKPASREQLTAWLVANRTGDARLRAGLPKGWRVGDKTGTGERGTSNDIAIVWPAGRAPVIVTAYLTGATKLRPAERDAVLAKTGAFVAGFMG